MKIDQLDSVSQLMIVGGQRKWIGATVPSTPQVGDKWEETTVSPAFGNLHLPRWGGNWEYCNTQVGVNLWLSNPVSHNLRFETNVSAGTDFNIPLEHFYGDSSLYRAFITGVTGYFRVTSNNDASNYWTLSLGYFRSDTLFTNFNNPFSTNTQSLTTTFPRVIDFNTNSAIVGNGVIIGNAWMLRFTPTKVGAPAGNLICALATKIRYSRP